PAPTKASSTCTPKRRPSVLVPLMSVLKQFVLVPLPVTACAVLIWVARSKIIVLPPVESCCPKSFASEPRDCRLDAGTPIGEGLADARGHVAIRDAAQLADACDHTTTGIGERRLP